jgi:DNA-directed RNA polymerase subunit RPC12/RpoP
MHASEIENLVKVGEVRGIPVYYNTDPAYQRPLCTVGKPLRLEARAIEQTEYSGPEYRWNWRVIAVDDLGREIGVLSSGYGPSGDPDSEKGRWCADHAAELSPHVFTRFLYDRTDGVTLVSETHCLCQDPELGPPDLGLVGGEEAAAILAEFRRLQAPRREAYARVRAALAEAESRRAEARRAALEMAERVPAGTRKEDFLPFVTAVLQHFAAAQGVALEHDEAAASFAIASEQLQYLADFRRLTGRDFDPARDIVTRAEVEALPVTPPAPPAPVVYECLECGAAFDEPGHVESGGMGCDRCNSSLAAGWRRHLIQN